MPVRRNNMSDFGKACLEDYNNVGNSNDSPKLDNIGINENLCEEKKSSLPLFD